MGGAGDEVDDVLLVPPHHSVFFLSEKPEDRNFFSPESSFKQTISNY